jgi:hypothetical protein
MPRNAWVKVDVDLTQHPLLADRPDSDVRLWVGLLGHAKKHSPGDGVVRLGALAMRSVFCIKASLKVVQMALAYFVARGVLLEVEGGYQIRDFVARQAPDSLAERQARWRDNSRDGRVTKRNGNASRNVYIASSEVEGEKEEKKDHSQSGESEGREFTACESVDNSTLAGLTNEQKAQVQRLFDKGEGPQAITLLASFRAKAKTGPGATA